MSEEADEISTYAQLIETSDAMAAALQKGLQIHSRGKLWVQVTSEIERYRVVAKPMGLRTTASVTRVIHQDELLGVTTSADVYTGYVKSLVKIFAEKLNVALEHTLSETGWYEATGARGDPIVERLQAKQRQLEELMKRREELAEQEAINSIYESWKSVPPSQLRGQ